MASVRFSTLIEGRAAGDAECRSGFSHCAVRTLGFAARSQVETWLRRKVDARPGAGDDVEPAATSSDSRAHGQSGWPGCGRFWPITRPTSCGYRARRSERRAASALPRPGRQPPAWAPEPAAAPTPSQEFLQLDTERRHGSAQRASARLTGVVILALQRLPFWRSGGADGPSRPSCRCFGCGRYGSCRRRWRKVKGDTMGRVAANLLGDMLAAPTTASR